MSQVLATTSGGVTSNYLRDDGASLLAGIASGTRTWYGKDNPGHGPTPKVGRGQTFDNGGNVLATQSYDNARSRLAAHVCGALSPSIGSALLPTPTAALPGGY